jgi:hypothetical protein
VYFGEYDDADAEHGVARLWFTTPGPHRFWVDAEDRITHDLRVLAHEGQTRVVTVTMRREPPGLYPDEDDDEDDEDGASSDDE